jgi:hypothetical protein
MKSLRLIQLSRLNLIIYLVIVALCILSILAIWNITSLIINPNKQPVLMFHTSVIRMKSDIYLDLKEDILKSDNNLYQKVQRNKSLYVSLRGVVVVAIIIAVLLQLKTIISSFSEESFFKSKNIRPVRRISYLLLIWILADLTFYLCIPLFIPLSVIRNTYNFWPINGDAFNKMVGIFTLLASINYGVLLSAFAFYVISIVFKEGKMLKEQADLTI